MPASRWSDESRGPEVARHSSTAPAQPRQPTSANGRRAARRWWLDPGSRPRSGLPIVSRRPRSRESNLTLRLHARARAASEPARGTFGGTPNRAHVATPTFVPGRLLSALGNRGSNPGCDSVPDSVLRCPKPPSDKRSGFGALLLYVLASVAIFGHGVLLHPGRDYVGWNVGADPQIFIWSIGWWPHAILHLENPFVTHAVNAPKGENLSWVTSVPGVALAMFPVTLLAGPVVSYNIAALLFPALAAWSAFVLARLLTRSWIAAALSGAYFGFSPYIAGQVAAGHMHLTSIFLVPLVAVVLLRFLRDELSVRGLLVRVGLLVAGQILLSTEVAVTVVLALVLCLGVGYLTAPSLRARLRVATEAVAGGLVLGCIITSPLLVYAILGFQRKAVEPPAAYPADLLNIVVPTHPTLVSFGWARTAANSFIAGEGESGAYLGVVALVIVAAFLWSRRRTPLGRFVAAILALALIAELGTRLYIHGVPYFRLPWSLLAGIPGLGNVLPVRLSMYSALAVAAVMALWMDVGGRHRAARLAVGAIAVLLILPSPHRDIWSTSPARPAFFAADIYKACLRPNESILIVPVPVQSFGWLWQAESGYRFRMIDGNLLERAEPQLYTIDISGHVSATSARSLLALARSKGAAAILVSDHFAFWRGLLAGYLRPVAIGGVVLYPLSGAGGCSSTSA